MNECPSCQETITRLTKGECPNCKTKLHKLAPGEYILESEKDTSAKMLDLFEHRITQVTKTTFYFLRGKTRVAQLHHCYFLFVQIKEYLQKQPTKLDYPDEAFALAVVAEIMTDDYARNANSTHGLTYKLIPACKTIYLEKINQKKYSLALEALDTSMKFDVMVL